MLKKSQHYWLPMIEEYMVPHPNMFNRIVRWYPYDSSQILIQFNTGTIRLYHVVNNVHICEPDHQYEEIRVGDQYEEDPYTYMDEDDWIDLFVVKFRRKFISAGMSIDYLVWNSGVSEQSIHKYRTARNIPSLYIANRLMNVMKRSLSELYVADYERIRVAEVRTPEEWDEIADEIILRYPNVARDVTTWYPIGLYEVHLRIPNGSRYVYDIRSKELIHVYSEDVGPVLIPEDEWREIYGERLRRYMDEVNMSRSALARIVGVTPMMMYKYMYGKSTPSLYKATRIARALGKTLTDFQVM